MTVKEYLEKMNNCVISNDMNTSLIQTVGLIDVMPSIGDINCFGYSNAHYDIVDDTIIATRVFNTEFGDLTVKKTTSLSDSIGFHGFGKQEEEIINETIIGLSQIVEMDKTGIDSKYRQVLEGFQNGLLSVKKN